MNKMNTVEMSVIPDCDICKSLGKQTDAKYDDKTTLGGKWAYLCEECFRKYGYGIGLKLKFKFK